MYLIHVELKLIIIFFFLICDVLKETEKIFRQEVNCLEAIEEVNLRTTPDSEPDISSVLSAYNRWALLVLKRSEFKNVPLRLGKSHPFCWFDLCLFKSKLVMQILQDTRTITAGRRLKLLTEGCFHGIKSVTITSYWQWMTRNVQMTEFFLC